MPSQRLLLIAGLIVVVPLPALAFPILSDLQDAAEAIGGISGVISGASNAAMDIADIVSATDELAGELGEEPTDGQPDPAMKATLSKIAEVRETYSEAGYTHEQIDDMLSAITSNQASIAKKIRSLRRTVRSLKQYQSAMSKLLGAKGALSGLDQARGFTEASSVHQQVQDNQLITNQQLDEHLKTARQEKSYRDTLLNDFQETFERLKGEQEDSLFSKSPLKTLKKSELMEIVWSAFILMVVICGFAISSMVFTSFGIRLLKLSFVAGLMIVLFSSLDLLPRLWGVS